MIVLLCIWRCGQPLATSMILSKCCKKIENSSPQKRSVPRSKTLDLCLKLQRLKSSSGCGSSAGPRIKCVSCREELQGGWFRQATRPHHTPQPKLGCFLWPGVKPHGILGFHGEHTWRLFAKRGHELHQPRQHTRNIHRAIPAAQSPKSAFHPTGPFIATLQHICLQVYE